MPRAYPEEFRGDVFEIVWRNATPTAQIAMDFCISDTLLLSWNGHRDDGQNRQELWLQDRAHQFLPSYWEVRRKQDHNRPCGY